MLAMEEKRNQTNGKERDIYKEGSVIEFESVGDLRVVSEALELLDPTSCYSGSGARTTSGAISGSDDITFFEMKAANLALMDVSAVVSARGGSCESLDLSVLSLSISSDDAHGVARLDLIDLVPANLMASERIDNYHAFIVKDHRGVQEDLVADCASKAAPNCSDNSAGKSVIQEVNVNQGGKEEESEIGEYIRTPGSEELAIIHEEIFSCEVEKRAA